MASGDGIRIYSPDYVVCQASAAVVNGTMSTGAVTAIDVAIPDEQYGYLLDFKISVTVGTPALGGSIKLFKRPVGQPVPASDFKSIFAGICGLDTVGGDYFIRGVANDGNTDTFYMFNDAGADVTIELAVRGHTYGQEA